MVKSLSVELHRDRIAEIHAGVDQFDKAILFTEVVMRNQAILNSVQTLHTGLQKTIAELRNRIASAPSPENSIWYHLVPWNNKTEQAAEAMALAAESFGATLLGIRTLAECYSVLGQFEAARSTLIDYFERVELCNVEHAADLWEPRYAAQLLKHHASPLDKVLQVKGTIGIGQGRKTCPIWDYCGLHFCSFSPA